jgi:multidrug efflux system membrane fusion protein
MTKSWSVVGAVAFLAVLAGGAMYYQKNQADGGNAKAANAPGGVGGTARGVPVLVAPVEQRSVPLKLNVIGRTEAYSNVTLRARMDGMIMSVNYTAGQHVNKGQVMLTLDPRALQAQLAQSEANLARDRAQLNKAKSDLDRNNDLVSKGFISAAQLEVFKSTVETMEATVKADLAQIDLAKVNLSYTTITAPMSGVAGAILVFPGGSVKANDTPLVVLNQVKPMYVTFAVPEVQLREVAAQRAVRKVQVDVKMPSDRNPPVSGELAFIDNTVDATTGTIQMKAMLPNQDERFAPGQFVEVSMVLRELTDALLIPSEALQAGPDGNFVYVAKADNTVEVRKVQTLSIGPQRLVVEKGLNPGEKVVTDGQLRLTPGARYEVRAPSRPEVPKGAAADAKGEGRKDSAPGAAEKAAADTNVKSGDDKSAGKAGAR